MASRIRPRTRRQYIAAAVAAVVVIGGGAYWGFGRANGAQTQSIVSTVATGTFKQTVSGTGTIQPASQADLDFDVSGRVTSVKVKAGDKVDKGDVLATLDTVSLDAALASAKAQLDAAETTAANDGSESSTQQASNNASVASAQADVTQAEDNLDAADLRSTITGTVASVGVAVGDQVGSSSGSSGASGGTGSTGSSGASTGSTGSTSSTTTVAVTVVTPKKFEVAVDVAADEISKVKKGLQVEITPNGATAAIFGVVSDVGLVAETSSSGTATFPVTVKITGDQTGLYAGTSATVSITVKQVENVLTVPSLALTTSGGKTYVEKVVGSSTKRTAVVVGTTYGASTEITSGLKVGDKVQVTTLQTVRRTGGTGTGTRTGGGEFPGGGAFPGGGTGGFPGGGFPGGGAR